MTNTKKCKVCSSLISIREAYHSALARFPFLSETDVKIIITHFNQIAFNELALHYEDAARNIDDFFNVCERVNDGYPLQYALHESEFLGERFYVDERVLIPRSETEELVIYMSKLISDENIANPIIADVCTGSGVIGLSLKRLLVNSKVYLSDISSDALAVAKINREKLNLDVEILGGASLAPLIKNNIKVDYLVANPPYVNSDDEVGTSVRQYEPHLALFSDDKIVYKEILMNVDKIMRTNTIVMMLEINELDGLMMLDLASGILGREIDAKIIKDIHGKDRFIFVRYSK